MTGRQRTTIITLVFALTALLHTRVEAAGSEGPTIISMRLRDVPAVEAYASLAKQAKLNIRYTWGPPPDDRRVTLNLVHEPFWEAMARLSKPGGMQIEWIRREPAQEIGLVPTAYRRSRKLVGTCVDGLFLATLDDMASDQELRAPADPTKRIASQLDLTLWAEPKVRGMLWHSIQVEEFTDDSGRPIEHKLPAKSSNFYSGGAHTLLQLRERPWPRRIGRLRISGRVLAAVESEVATVTQLMLDEPPVVSAGGFRIETNARPGPEGRLVTLIMTRLGDTGPAWLRPATRLWLLEPIIFDRDGQRLGVSTRDRDWFGRLCRLQLQVHTPTPRPGDPPYGDPHKLVMEIPTEVAEYDVRLEFSNVTLH